MRGADAVRIDAPARRRARLGDIPSFAIVGLSTVFVAGLFASALAPHDPLEVALDRRLLPPVMFGGDAHYLLGTVHRAGVIKDFVVGGRRVRRPRAIRCNPHRASANNGGQRNKQNGFRFHKIFSRLQFRLPLFVRRRVKFRAIHGHKNSVERTKATVSGSGHTAGVVKGESDEPRAILRIKWRGIRGHQR